MVLCHVTVPRKTDWIHGGGRKLVQIINENINFFFLRKKPSSCYFKFQQRFRILFHVGRSDFPNLLSHYPFGFLIHICILSCLHLSGIKTVKRK